MQIPIPQRFSPRFLIGFAVVMFAAEQMQGTDFLFSVLVALYIGIWGVAFNSTGGIEYVPGAFIFFNGLFTVIVGMVAKVFLWQPGNRNLLSPRSTMLCYCIGMGAMWLASIFSRSLRTRRPLLKDFSSLEAVNQAATVALFLGFAIFIGFGAGGGARSGTLATAINQLNRFPYMAILLGVSYEVRRSGGKRSLNWVSGLSMILISGVGLVYFAKEAMLIGPTAWILAAMLNRYNFTRTQIITTVIGFAFMVYYLVPYSQYVRLYSTSSRTENVAVALKYLSNLNETRRLYEASLENFDLNEQQHLFDQRISFLDRLIMFAPDDALIHYTNEGNVFGLVPTLSYNANVIPHFIWKDKPDIAYGNYYAHELGVVSEDDYTTGISFSPASEFYREAKWLGLLLVMPLEMFLAFLVSDSVVGSTRDAPWALLWILEVTHLASEGGAAAPVYLYTYGLLTMLFTYWTLTRVAPWVLSVVRRNRAGSAPAMVALEGS